MALNNIQERVEKSLYEVIRKLLVSEGKLPDINDSVRYPVVGDFMTPTAQQNWESDVDVVQNTMDFAAEVFGHSSSQAKGLKRVPRIVIIPRRIVPGDIGFNPGVNIGLDPLDPDNYIATPNPQESSNMYLDISLISNKAIQDRFLNNILNSSLGIKKYIPFYDNPNERFFIKQTNYFDLPDTAEGVDEKVYSFEVSDLYLFDGSPSTPVSLIKEITINTTLLELRSMVASNTIIIGPYIHEGNLFIDLSGFKFN